MARRRGTVIVLLLALLAACTSAPAPAIEARSSARVAAADSAFLTATIVPPIPPMPSPTLAGPLAEVIAWLDMGEGSAAFDAMIYGQDVYSGATYKAFMSVGDHHAEAVRRKTPETLLVQAPGRYVFYARLTYVPELYHWGYTGCPPLTDCGGQPLLAIDVEPEGTYEIRISDRGAVLPQAGAVVTVPWVLQAEP